MHEIDALESFAETLPFRRLHRLIGCVPASGQPAKLPTTGERSLVEKFT
jgi:hypothetical protein